MRPTAAPGAPAAGLLDNGAAAGGMPGAGSMRHTTELYYRVDQPARGHFPGHHRSRRGDSGFEFRGHAPLRDAPDPRRLDLHATLRDPFGDWRVRLYSQRQSVPVVVLADLSASMGFSGQQRRAEVMADLVGSLAWSAWRAGDSFGFIGCDAQVRADWLQWPTRARGPGQALAEALRGWAPVADGQAGAASAAGLLQAPRHLGRQRALLFLVSDFHWPAPLLPAVLAGLAGHQVLPVVLWDPQEFTLGPRRGLARVVDPETGLRRLVWWRPALRARWQQAHAARRLALQQTFAAHRLSPLFVEGAFDADAVTRHFHGG